MLKGWSKGSQTDFAFPADGASELPTNLQQLKIMMVCFGTGSSLGRSLMKTGCVSELNFADENF